MIEIVTLIKVVALGILEGVTEFLPISSTGHLILGVAILRPSFTPEFAALFEIFIQLGAIIAVVLYYRRDLIARAAAVRGEPTARRFWLNLLIAFVPAAIVGLIFREWITDVLFNPTVVAVSLIVGGIALILIERRAPAESGAVTQSLDAITPRQALGVGIAQTIALIPGVSRAAASIAGAMLLGFDRVTATRFSFYLAIPTLGAATVLELLLSLDEIQSGDWVYLFVGLVVALIVAWLSIGWLLRYIGRRDFTVFGVYRIIVGGVVLFLIAAGTL